MPNAAREKRKPVYVARVGNVQVPVYRNGETRFCVAWRKVAGGGRERESFGEKKAACARADEVALAIANSQADVVTLSSADRDGYRLAVQKLAPLGVPLHVAVDEYVAARAVLPPGRTLLEAADALAQQALEAVRCPETGVILAELEAELVDDRRSARHLRNVRKDLGRFAAAFPRLEGVTEEEVRAYLRGLRTSRRRRRKDGTLEDAGAEVSARRRDGVRESIVRLFRFARKRGYLADRTTVVEVIPKISEGGEVTTYGPEQLAQILGYFWAHDREWLPWAAIAAFAGLRTTEILRLEWSAFRWEAEVIAVKRSVAKKVRTARQAPILEPLVAWLRDWRRETSGPVIPRKWANLERAHSRALGRMLKALGWKTWDNNALRHSFGSNRLALVGSYARVALDMGNSEAKVREHYNDPKPEVEARRYFAVMPPAEAANVVTLRQTA